MHWYMWYHFIIILTIIIYLKMGANNTTNNESKFSDISSLINESIVEQSSKNSFNYNSYITQDIS